MNFETNRLNTFSNWPTSAPVDPIRIAKAGFFYTGEGTEVQCFSCGGKISQWNYGDQVMWRHRRMEPNCSFVVNPRLSGNVPLVLGRECPTTDSSASWSLPDQETNDSNQTPTDYGFIEEDEIYRNDALRLLTFINWTDTSVSREELVNAGFYHAGEGRLRCAWCGGELAPFRNFGSLGPPLEVHRMYFPRCRHAAALEETRRPRDLSPQVSQSELIPPSQEISSTPDNNQPQSEGAAHNERLLSGGAGGTWRTLGVVGGGARHPTRAGLAARLATFDRWPADRQQSPHTLAEAGFFYTGVDDQVRCFYCDGGLGKWEAGDAPWSEHAHWFPHCGYVLLVKGQEFVDSCRNKGAVQRTFSADSGLSTRRRNPGVNFPVTQSQVEECLESSIALAALSAGLDAARVRRAIMRRLRSTGLSFTSSEALIDAVLDEQLGEEPWSASPRGQTLAREIFAETLRDITPYINGNPTQWVDRPDSRRSVSESSAASPTPLNSNQTLIESENMNNSHTNNRLQNSSELEVNNAKIDLSKTGDKDKIETEKRGPTPEPDKKQLSLEEENRQLKEARLCKVCMDSEVSVVFLPCGHLVSCARCGAALGACPMCRASVRALVRAYLA